MELFLSQSHSNFGRKHPCIVSCRLKNYALRWWMAPIDTVNLVSKFLKYSHLRIFSQGTNCSHGRAWFLTEKNLSLSRSNWQIFSFTYCLTGNKSTFVAFLFLNLLDYFTSNFLRITNQYKKDHYFMSTVTNMISELR